MTEQIKSYLTYKAANPWPCPLLPVALAGLQRDLGGVRDLQEVPEGRDPRHPRWHREDDSRW